MFSSSTSSNNIPNSLFPHPSENSLSSSIADKSSSFHSNSAKGHRQSIKKRMRMAHNVQLLPYQGVVYKKFAPLVQAQNNMYSLLRTIFAITDESNWRHYITHLQILIKKFTNNIATSNGKILQELTYSNTNNIFDGYSLQERVESMLHLSDKIFQQHLLIFIHGLIAYNRRYGILDESSLSIHLLHRHNYEQHPGEEIFWLLSRMTISPEAIQKILRNFYSFPTEIPLLSILMILSTYIYEQPTDLIQSLIETKQFQQILNLGLYSSHFETEREAVLIFNNLLFKSRLCCQFVIGEEESRSKILGLKNEESAAFRELFKQALLNEGEEYFVGQNNT